MKLLCFALAGSAEKLMAQWIQTGPALASLPSIPSLHPPGASSTPTPGRDHLKCPQTRPMSPGAESPPIENRWFK